LERYNRSSVSEFLDDLIVYRSLIPVDQRLPSLSEYRRELNLPAYTTPRKSSKHYAQVITRILVHARALIFGLSDKPDEASIPAQTLAKLGHLPLHQIKTDVVGGSIK